MSKIEIEKESCTWIPFLSKLIIQPFNIGDSDLLSVKARGKSKYYFNLKYYNLGELLVTTYT